jgi:hypothetical protein
MLAMIAGLHSPRRKPQVNAIDQVFGTYRLRSDRCLYHDPPPRPPGAGGRPRRYGAKFAFTDPTTWPAPTATLHTTDGPETGLVGSPARPGLV